MNKYKLKKRILITVIILFVILLAHFILTTLFDHIVFGLKEIKMSKDCYEEILNKNYYMEIIPDNFSSAIGTGNCYFYKYKNNDILIMELHQYSEILVNDIIIRNNLLKGENKNFIRFKTSIQRQLKHKLYIDLYPKFKKEKNLGLYIGPKLEFKKEGKNFLYIKFIENTFSISSIEDYPELDFYFPVEDFPIELLIMKYHGRTLFVIKYKIDPNEKDENETLLDLINLDNL